MASTIRNNLWRETWNASTMANACTLRVTNQCDQRCRHCCFRSGPECVGQMSVDMCEKMNSWVPKGVYLNVMGGEITVLDNYPEILFALSRNRSFIRIVTNGFWSQTPFDIKQFLLTLEELTDMCRTVDVAVSTDHWHKNHYTEAIRILKENDKIKINIIPTYDLGEDDITPIGRAWDNKISSRSKFSAISSHCKIMCNTTITEDGMLNRCPYGYLPWKHFIETTWADAQDYIWGWRSEKLIEGMNCHLCMEIVETSRVRDLVQEVSV